MNTTKYNTWLPELIYLEGGMHVRLGLRSDDVGRFAGLVLAREAEDPILLSNRVVLPGMVNAHSHAFQRVLRGRTEYRTANQRDSFWTWREMMYEAASRLTPEDIYDASRMAFLEMILGGITAVGEFHYLHNDPAGVPYDDPNLLAKQVVRAATDVGLRIALLRVAYARSGFQTETNPLQVRFIEKDPEKYLKNLDALDGYLKSEQIKTASALHAFNAGPDWSGFFYPDSRPEDPLPMSWAGVAPHSVRAVGMEYLKAVVRQANKQELPVHMHVAEQPAEVSACIEEYGRSPLALLQTEGLLSDKFTAVHAIHVTPKEVTEFSSSGAIVCACPTTERNLGDGIFPTDRYFKTGVRVALGTDSHAQIDLLEDARELEYHLRLQRTERAVLCDDLPVLGFDYQDPNYSEFLAAKLFKCASVNSAESIGFCGGRLAGGDSPADFFTVDLNDPCIAGASQRDLLPSIVFSASRVAVRDVFVGGKQIVSEGRHPDQEAIVSRFNALQQRLWSR